MTQGKIKEQSTAARSTNVFGREVIGTPAGRVDFRPELFDRLIEEKGYEVRWEKAIVCPCAKIGADGYTAQPSLDCTVCDDGYRYIEPQIIRAVMTEITEQHDYMRPHGQLIIEDVKVTTRHIHPLDFMDKITMQHSLIRYSEVLNRSANSRDIFRYPVEQMITALTETTTFTEGIDFRIIDNLIDWSIAASPPAEDETYSVAYMTRPVYKVIQFPHKFRDTQVAFQRRVPEHEKLPVQAVARFDFIRDRDSG